MATTSGGSAGGTGRGRVVRRTASAGRQAAARKAADAPAPPPSDHEPGPESATNPVAADPPPANPPPAGRLASARSGLDALAARRVPKVPHAPGGMLPTTRRGVLRYRVLPRSVVGISMLILAFAVGAGFSGVVLFSYYQFRQNQADTKVNALISGYKGQFARAEADLNAEVAAARASIATQLKGVQSLQAGPSQIAALIKQIAPSVFFVHTLDAGGQPSVGTAFVVSSNSSQSLLLTSYNTVTAATTAPGPAVYVSQGDSGAQTPVTVRTWDPQYDLALLILPKGGLAALPAAPTSPSPQPGDRLFAVSGLGSAGASLTQGSVIDVSSNGLQVDASIGTAFQGGPVIDQSGHVVAVGSRSYAPLGFTSNSTYFVPFVEAACSKVLSCPGGTLAGSH
jgi:S1-C subfamily serine protease